MPNPTLVLVDTLYLLKHFNDNACGTMSNAIQMLSMIAEIKSVIVNLDFCDKEPCCLLNNIKLTKTMIIVHGIRDIARLCK